MVKKATILHLTRSDSNADVTTYKLPFFFSKVGFNAGDNMNYYSVPNSRTNDIVHITETTNVGRPGSEGRWVFRIDNKEIVAAGCEDRTSCKYIQIGLWGTCA